MKYLHHILKLIYRIRWWLVIVPILLTLLAIYSTKNLVRNYHTNTTIYTGVISGYTVESISGAAINLSQQNTTLDNILNLINSESTLKRVSLKLYAQNMMHGDLNHDNNYIKASTYKALLSITPKEVQKLIDKKDEKKTIARLQAYEKPNSKNFVFGLFNWFHPDYSYSALLKKIKVERIENSDMIEINYSSEDPGIAYNTLKILNEEFTEQYQNLRFGETNDVIRFYEEELAKLAKALRISEDSLTEYNIKKRVINYDWQTRELAGQNTSYEQKYEDFLLDYNSSKTLIAELDRRIDSHIKSLRNNSNFINKLQHISDLTTQITNIETLKNENSLKDQNLSVYKKQLKKAENDFNNFAEQYSDQKFTKDGINSESIVEQWFEQILKMEKATAQIKVMNSRKGLLDEQYLYYSPVGSTLKRKERNINFIEQNYLSILNSLNNARMRQKNLQMTSATLRVMNPPIFPIVAEATKRKTITMTVFLGSIILILGFFLIIELLDRTLRDQFRTERITSCKVIGAFPDNESIRYRNYSKAQYHIATQFLNNAILNYLPSNKKRIINIISTENNDGKSFIGEKLEQYWAASGLLVKRITWHEDFSKDSKTFLLAKSINDIYPNEDKDTDIYIVEYPQLKECTIPTLLLNEASLNLVIAKATRTWKFTDQLLLDQIKQRTDSDSPVVICLNKASTDVVESFTGLLPPYNRLKRILYRYSQFGLTASE